MSRLVALFECLIIISLVWSQGILSGTISVWQHVKLSVQICPWDTQACCWDVKQPTNKQSLPPPPPFLSLSVWRQTHIHAQIQIQRWGSNCACTTRIHTRSISSPLREILLWYQTCMYLQIQILSSMNRWAIKSCACTHTHTHTCTRMHTHTYTCT